MLQTIIKRLNQNDSPIRVSFCYEVPESDKKTLGVKANIAGTCGYGYDRKRKLRRSLRKLIYSFIAAFRRFKASC